MPEEIEIPTREELARERRAKLPVWVKDEVDKFKTEIVQAMRNGRSDIPVVYRMPSAEAKEELILDFAHKGWLVVFASDPLKPSISWV
jgi:hypothetical protein